MQGSHNNGSNVPAAVTNELKLDHYLALNNPLYNASSSISSSRSSDESHDSSISSWQRHQLTGTTAATRGDPLSHLENEVAKLSAAIKRHRKYTPEWFVIDTKLSAAKEELDAVKEDRDLDFLDMNDPLPREGQDESNNIDGILGIPETVMIRSEKKRNNNDVEMYDETSTTQREYELAVQQLHKIDKFSDEWFLLQEQVIKLRTNLMDEAATNTTQSEAETFKEKDSSYSVSDDGRDNEEAPVYLMPEPFVRALSDTKPKQEFRPAPYHERSFSLPSDSLFVTSRSISPPPMLYSPPSSPLTTRNLFENSANINSSYYSHNEDDEERLISTEEDEHLVTLRSEYSEACVKLDATPQFSKEWFDLKTKTANLEEQIENCENGSVGGSSRLSYGIADRSMMSEEDEDIMSFASDLELCMIGEALKQGNCLISSFDDDAIISPIGNDEYCDDNVDDLALDKFQFPDLESSDKDAKENMSATSPQTQCRKHHSSKAYSSFASNAVKLQAFIRGKALHIKHKQQKKQLKMSSNIVSIQSVWRGNSQRKKFLQTRNAAISIQSFVRMKQQKKNYRMLRNTILIQSVVRGWIARNRIHQTKRCVSRSIPQDQDSFHIRSTGQYHSNSSAAMPSIEVLQSHYRVLAMRRSQMPKFTDEWFYITELLQGVEHELRIQEREQSQNTSDEVMSMEDSRCEDDLSTSIPSIEESTSPYGQSSRDSWADLSSNHIASSSSKNIIRMEEESLRCAGKECLRLTRKLGELPRFSDEWFQCKVELKLVTDELEVMYSYLEISKK